MSTVELYAEEVSEMAGQLSGEWCIDCEGCQCSPDSGSCECSCSGCGTCEA